MLCFSYIVPLWIQMIFYPLGCFNISSSPGQIATIPQTTFSNVFSCMEKFDFRLKFHKVSSYGSNWYVPSIGLDNGLSTNRRQAIIWTNADRIHWCINAALGWDELIQGWTLAMHLLMYQWSDSEYQTGLGYLYSYLQYSSTGFLVLVLYSHLWFPNNSTHTSLYPYSGTSTQVLVWLQAWVLIFCGTSEIWRWKPSYLWNKQFDFP